MEQFLIAALPLLVKAAPFIEAAAKGGVDIDWAAILKAEAPLLLGILEKLAQKLFPDMSPKQALIHVVVWAFLPKAYTPEMEEQFFNRGMVPPNENNDFWQPPSN